MIEPAPLEPDKPALYYSYIPAMTERSAGRRFDAVALKEIRKRLDTGACDQQEVDQIATDLLEDCVDVSTPSSGNLPWRSLTLSTSNYIAVQRRECQLTSSRDAMGLTTSSFTPVTVYRQLSHPAAL